VDLMLADVSIGSDRLTARRVGIVRVHRYVPLAAGKAVAITSLDLSNPVH
jgi:hypothetical protein